jgi:alpha-glucosidase
VVDVDGRDPERAPMPWTAGPHAGFSTAEPWLPLVAGWQTLNVAAQAADPASALQLTRRLAALRAATPALQTGARTPLDAGRDVVAWRRGEDVVAAINFGDAPAALPLTGELLVSSDPGRAPGATVGDLAAAEGVLLRIVPGR